MLNTQMGLQMGARDRMIEDDDAGIEAFAVKFKAGVVAAFGARSPQAARVPRLVVRKSRAKKPASGAAGDAPPAPPAA